MEPPGSDRGAASPSGPSFELTLTPQPEHIAAARQFVADAVRRLERSPDEGRVEDAKLLASEAIANAVEHAGTNVVVRVERTMLEGRSDGDAIMVSIHDESRTPIPKGTPPAPDQVRMSATSGRGLALINAIADEWGVVSIHDDGKVLWFVIEGS